MRGTLKNALATKSASLGQFHSNKEFFEKGQIQQTLILIHVTIAIPPNLYPSLPTNKCLEL
jgi:hypothetical protein